MAMNSKKKFYFEIKDGSMKRAIDAANRYEGVTDASPRRLHRKQLKVYGVDIRAADLRKFLEDEIGFAKLLDVKDVLSVANILSSLNLGAKVGDIAADSADRGS